MKSSQHLGVEAAYDAWATIYDSYDNPMVYAARAALAPVLGQVAGQTCLEFGCGTGANLAAMATAGAERLIGLDLSAGMLAPARALNPTWDLRHHDMTKPLDFADQSVDFILFSLSLEHVKDLHRPLQEAQRLLRPGGTIAIVEIHPFLAQQGVAAHFSTPDDQTITMPSFVHRFEDWLSAFNGAGLSVAGLKEWYGSDFSTSAPEKITRRGPHWPWVVAWTLVAAKNT
jgi:ubiquinone/menaquinone biosynthesis C-methylase UbiE